MLTMLARLTLKKKSHVLLLWFNGAPYTGSQQNSSDKMFVSQLQPVRRCWSACGLRSPRAPGWLELASNIFYMIGSAVFQCMEYH
jgi:hypothetical protein